MKNLVQKLRKKFLSQDGKFLQNLGWLGISGAVNRLTRLLTTIVLARFLTQYDYGLAAIVLTTNEFVRVFTQNGIGIKLIQADEEKVESLAQSAYWLNWMIFTGLFFVQCIAAFPIAFIYGDQQLILPICVMGLGLLLVPHGLVQVFLIRRENRLRILSIVQMVQISTDNILSLIFAIAGFGMWSIVLPKILVSPIWVIFMLRNHSWRPKCKFTNNHWRELIRYGRAVLGVELLNTLRNNLDYLIVGRFLSIEALGVYYFAFNAGLGISLGIIKSLKLALLPHLCSVRTNIREFKTRYLNSLKTIAMIIIPMVLLQSAFAPFYVPIVFGEKWIVAIPVLILICLSAIPRPFADSASQLLLAVDKPEIDLKWNLLFTVVFAIALSIGVHWQSQGVAASVLITHGVFMPLFTIWATRYVFRQRAKMSNG
ncbi:MAG: lipopolysaccharide biosynthesis protein [Cyanobacteria bacterium P01_F01_bin.143]